MPAVEPMDAYFAGLYGASEDPYRLQTRWYEQRKRASVLSSLPCMRYASAYEPGCGAAALTAGCNDTGSRALRPLSSETIALFDQKGVSKGSPTLLRAYKRLS